MNAHSISNGKVGCVVTSARLSNLVLMGGLAAAIGAASGALVDTQPLKWGEDADWREHLPRTQELVASAIRNHNAFETAKRNQVRDLDYLAENEVIYLRPIDATVDGDLSPAPLESHRGQMYQGASSQDVGLDMGPQQPQFEPIVDEIGDDQRRLADTGPRIVEFPVSIRDGG